MIEYINNKNILEIQRWEDSREYQRERGQTEEGEERKWEGRRPKDIWAPYKKEKI